jgi:hypothetical protein
VLTDEAERARYDRLGHERYVDGSDGTDPAEGAGGDADPDHTDGEASRHQTGGEDPGARSSGAQAATDGAGAGTAGTATGGGRDPGRRGRREHVGTPSWSGHREAEAGGARAWNPDAPYAVRRSESGIGGLDGSAVAVLAVTFLTYPILVGGALFPGFPPLLNALIGGCALGIVAYLQSVPLVGILVFGGWLVLAPVVLVALGVSAFSVVGAAVLLAVALPLGLSGLTYLALG